jgi:concentrative nucleoside transporter, CNT family
MREPPAAGPSARALRLAAVALAILLPLTAWLLADPLGPRGRAALGALALIALVGACSPDLRQVNWRTVGWGLALQIAVAFFILRFEMGGVRPGYELFAGIARGAARFLAFTDAGAAFVFGPLADESRMGEVFGTGSGFVFVFRALPPIIFISSFFTVLYHVGVLPFIVRLVARLMMRLMRTSGAETLSAAANVFMGQVEAPLMVRPFIGRMTQSELLALMTGGMATIAGAMMVVYIALGADPIAILTTSVMAAPCGLYLSKLMLPEREQPETAGQAPAAVERRHANVIDAAASGAADGLTIALGVAAMLIAFLAFLALFDFALDALRPGLTMAGIFATVFAPLAFLMGVPAADVAPVADLLGTKLVANEFVAFVKLTTEYEGVIADRSYVLATYALTGFANFASVGIQLGGLGGMAPGRRGDLARLGMRALLAGFVATIVNACLASVIMP